MEFFVFESPKVLMLLVLVVFGVGIVRSFFTPERTRRILAGKRESVGNLLAALLGIVTPFCSCSAVPLFIGFVTAGVPLGVTFSFLISAPMVNEVAVVLPFGLLGSKVAGLYMVTGVSIAVVSGWTIGRLRLERHVEEWVFKTRAGDVSLPEERLEWADRIEAGWQAMKDIVGKVWPYVLASIAGRSSPLCLNHRRIPWSDDRPVPERAAGFDGRHVLHTPTGRRHVGPDVRLHGCSHVRVQRRFGA